MSEKHLFKFQTDADYKTAKRNHLTIPNVSTIVETGDTYINSEFVSKENAEAGDIIVFHENEDGTKTIKYIKPEAFNKEDDYWTADAIVVVPYSHTGDGTVRAMALKYASVTTPEQGSDNGESIMWGAKFRLDDLKLYGGKTFFTSIQDQTFDSTFSIETADTHNAKLPFDNFSVLENGGILNPYDTETCYENIDYTAVCSSPYNNDGTPNDAYHSTGDFSMLTQNPLQDMDGAGNTLTILKALDENYLDETIYAQTLDNAQTKTIDNEEVELYPIACACARYGSALKPCTFDSSKSVEENIATMPWYVPSAGELGYYMVRKGRIMYALEQVLESTESRRQMIFGSTVGVVDEEDVSDSLYNGAVAIDSRWFSEDLNYHSINEDLGIGAIPFCKF